MTNYRDVKFPEKTVKLWLEEFEKSNINPWKYCFQNEIYENIDKLDEFRANPIELMLRTWKDLFDKTDDFGRKKTSKSGEIEDTVLAQCIYEVLWGLQSKHSLGKPKQLDADIMNTFWYTYYFYLETKFPRIFKRPFNDGKRLAKKGGGFMSLGEGQAKIFNDKIKDFNESSETEEKLILSDEAMNSKNSFWLTFLLDNKKIFVPDAKSEVALDKAFIRYAGLTTTLGNFTLEPLGFNAGRGGYDYWDHALKTIKGFEGLCLNFDEYIRKFYMDGYVEVTGEEPSKFKVKTLMNQNNKNEYGCLDINEIQSFLESVNSLIYERGKFMVEHLAFRTKGTRT